MMSFRSFDHEHSKSAHKHLNFFDNDLTRSGLESASLRTPSPKFQNPPFPHWFGKDVLRITVLYGYSDVQNLCATICVRNKKLSERLTTVCKYIFPTAIGEMLGRFVFVAVHGTNQGEH